MSWPHSRAGGRWRRPLRERSASPARGICSARGVCCDRRVPRPRELLPIGAGRRRCRPGVHRRLHHHSRRALRILRRAIPGPRRRARSRPQRPGLADGRPKRDGGAKAHQADCVCERRQVRREPADQDDSASRSHVMEWAHRRTKCVRPVWFASDSTPQIRGLIRPHLAGSPAPRGGVQDDRARTTEHAERAPPRPQRGTGLAATRSRSQGRPRP